VIKPVIKATLAILICSTLGTPAHAARENWRSRSSEEEVVTSGDVTAEIKFGREIAARILGSHPAYENEELTKYVNLVGNTLAMNTNRPELEFHFAVLNTDELNAYAAPGGYIFITKGALKYMNDESELAGVLAHEVAHVAEKHVVKELKIHGTDDSGTSDLAKLIGGGSDAARAAFGQAIDKGLEMIYKDGYKKEDELQADKSAVTICALSGYDPSGLSRYLARIKPIKEKVPLPAKDDHPTFDLRMKSINTEISSNGIDARTLARKNVRFGSMYKYIK
jgi:beta-barrel assembly-enhancing protease